MMGDFPTKDKIVVVTGGASGIGFAYVQQALKAGAKGIIIGDLQLTENSKDLVGQQPNVIFEKCDVTKWADLQNLINASISNFGDVPDIYLASAGVFEPLYSNFWHDPEPLEANGYAQVDVNVNHPIKLTRLALRALLGKRKPGVIVLIASITGYLKQYTTPIYSATKHAVVGFARSMGDAEEFQGVKVVAVCPGFVATAIWTKGTPGSREKYMITDDLCITPESVADCISAVVGSGKYRGGTIMEVSKFGIRVIPEWFISPPGSGTGEEAIGTDVPPVALQRALEPILAITEKERGGQYR